MSDFDVLVGTGAMASAFGISEYEVREFRKSIAETAGAVVDRKFSVLGVELLGERLGLSAAVMAEKKRGLGFAVGAAEKNAGSASAALGVPADGQRQGQPAAEAEAGVDLMVARVCPNPTWVKGFAADAARGAEPVEVRVPNNRLLKPGQWLRGCKKQADGRFVWAGQASVIFGRRSK